ncbi:MAG: GspMb/PilO family protein [Planctomycetota bacterium]
MTIAERINNKCSEAADAGGFYDRLTKVAEQSGLSIAGVQPKRGGAVGDASSLVTRSAYSMQVSGSYEDITKFLHRLNADFPLTAVIGVRIVPTPIAEKPDAVNATIDLATFTLAEMINVEADALDGELIGGVS